MAVVTLFGFLTNEIYNIKSNDFIKIIIEALYGYDEDGRKVTMSDISGTTSYEYDGVGRITAVELSYGGKILYSYDEYGNLAKLTYPDATHVSYEYDELDRLIKITDRKGLSTTYTYNLAGDLVEVLRPNDTKTNISHNEMGQIIKLVNSSTDKELFSFAYEYDLSGFITKETAKQGPNHYIREFTYDHRGQITKIAENNGYYTTYITYSYDKVGNRITQVEKKGNNIVLEIINTFNKADRLTKSVNTANYETKTTTYEYDQNGNLVKKNMPYATHMIYEYSVENRLTTIRDKQKLLLAALYDGNGDRVFSVTTKFDSSQWHDNGNNGEWQDGRPGGDYDDGSWHGTGNQGGNPSYDDGQWKPDTEPKYDDGQWKPDTEPKYNDGQWRPDTEPKYNDGQWKPDTQEISSFSTSNQTNDGKWVPDDYTEYAVDYNKDLINDIMLIPNGINEWNAEIYVITGYINDVNTEHTRVLMEYGSKGYIGNIYEYGVQRNTVRNLSKTHYYDYDGRGSVSEVITENARTVMSYSYTAFGESTVRYSGYVKNPYRYNGEYVDWVPGVPDFQYLRARYYTPYEGRFINEDSLFGDMNIPLTQNLYLYVINNAMNMIDPSGHISEPLNRQKLIKYTKDKIDKANKQIGVLQTYLKNPDVQGSVRIDMKNALSKEQKDLEKMVIQLDRLKNPGQTQKYTDDAKKNSVNKICDEGTGKEYVTADQLNAMGWTGVTDSMVKDLNRVLFKYEINTVERIRHFLAQTQHESGNGRAIIEKYMGNSPEEYFSNRDFRPEYEHNQAGDGAKYRGAGYMQLTWKATYRSFSEYVEDNKIVEEGTSYVASNYAWESAGWFWKFYKGLNEKVDSGYNVTRVTKVVNGGSNGLDERILNYNKATEIIK